METTDSFFADTQPIRRSKPKNKAVIESKQPEKKYHESRPQKKPITLEEAKDNLGLFDNILHPQENRERTLRPEKRYDQFKSKTIRIDHLDSLLISDLTSAIKKVNGGINEDGHMITENTVYRGLVRFFCEALKKSDIRSKDLAQLTDEEGVKRFIKSRLTN